MHNTRYCKFGWTRRPPKEHGGQHKKKYYLRKKCKSLLEDQPHHPVSSDEQPTRIQLKKTRSNAQSSTSFTALLFKNTTNNKGNGKTKSLPHKPAAKSEEIAAKLSATMTPIQGYVPVTSFKHSTDIDFVKIATQRNKELTEDHLSENSVQHETTF